MMMIYLHNSLLISSLMVLKIIEHSSMNCLEIMQHLIVIDTIKIEEFITLNANIQGVIMKQKNKKA